MKEVGRAWPAALKSDSDVLELRGPLSIVEFTGPILSQQN